MIPLWHTKIDDEGNLELPKGLDFKVHCDNLAGQKVVLTLDKEKSVRSLDQNALYWVWLEIIAEVTGHSRNELHEIYKRMFLEPKYTEYQGKKIKMPRSTTELSVSEMSEYLQRIEVEAGELGINLPREDEVRV